MTDETNNEKEKAEETPPIGAPATPPEPPKENPPTPPAQPAGNPIKELQDSLAALPEAVANAVREAMPPPPAAPPAPPKEKAKSTEEKPPPPAETKPGKKSFGEWWFGR